MYVRIVINKMDLISLGYSIIFLHITFVALNIKGSGKESAKIVQKTRNQILKIFNYNPNVSVCLGILRLLVKMGVFNANLVNSTT